MIWLPVALFAIIVLFVCARIGAMLADEAGAELDAGPAPKCPGARASVPYESEIYTEADWLRDMGAQPERVWRADGTPVYDGRFHAGEREYALRHGLMKEDKK
jgi:hypothetical protein